MITCLLDCCELLTQLPRCHRYHDRYLKSRFHVLVIPSALLVNMLVGFARYNVRP